jgi:hypothetical protein
MTNDTSSQQKWITAFKIFTLTCVGFMVTTIFVMFFEEDLFRIFTPFLVPFIWLFMLLGYLVLVVSSFIYVPLQIRKVAWRVFIPIIINFITFFLVYYLYTPLENLRIDLGFKIKEDKFNQVVQWVNQSVKSGDLILEEGKTEFMVLPDQYRGVADRNRVWVTQENGVINIFFNRGGGMFESYPGFMYRSDDISPPIEDGDIVCTRKIMSTSRI